MTFYILVFSFCIGIALIAQNELSTQNNKKNYSLGVFLVFSLLFIISAIRFNVGTDYIVYQNHAKNILALPFKEAVKEFEFFFIVLVHASNYLTNSMQFFYVIIAFVMLFFLHKGLVYHNKKIAIPIFLLFLTTTYFMSLNIMRQMTSFAIGLYSIKHIEHEKTKNFYALILFAFLWHKSAILFFFFPFLRKKDITKHAFLGIALFASLNQIINKFVFNFLVSRGLPLSYYFKLQEEHTSLFLIAISAFIFFTGHFLTKEKTRNGILYLNINYLILILSIFTNGVPGGHRLVYVLWPFYIVICPYIINNSILKQKHVLTLIYTIVFFSFFYKNQILANNSEVLPYRTIFENICTNSINYNITNSIYFS
ncbi:MAG: EpsG family protein [Fibrobacter sp.]|nr:EpsG family protein [Fibrobacter sp.]